MIVGGAPLLLKANNLAVNEQPLDATTLSEVDPNNRLSYTATRMTATGLERGVVTYAYKDYGSQNIGEVTADIDIRLTSSTLGAQCLVFGFRDALGTISDSGIEGIYCDEPNPPTSPQRRIAALIGGVGFGARIGITLNTTYYCRLVRDYTTGSVTLYVATSSANRDSETWMATSTATRTGTPVIYRYVVTSQSYDVNGTSTCSIYVENMFIEGQKA